MVLELAAIRVSPSLGWFLSLALDFTYGNLAVFFCLPSYFLSYLISFIRSISVKTSLSEFLYLQIRTLTNSVNNGRCDGGQETFQEMSMCGCLFDVVRLKGNENPRQQWRVTYIITWSYGMRSLSVQNFQGPNSCSFVRVGRHVEEKTEDKSRCF